MTATAVGGTHPTEMLSWYYLLSFTYQKPQFHISQYKRGEQSYCYGPQEAFCNSKTSRPISSINTIYAASTLFEFSSNKGLIKQLINYLFISAIQTCLKNMQHAITSCVN